jgi:lipoprotein-releasing system permease protein
MNTLPLLLAFRYLQSGLRKKTIGIMLAVCFSGIFIASFALALILSIMNGFEQTTHKKLQGMHADIIMQAPGQHINFDALKPILRNNNSIVAFSPSEIKQGLITNPVQDEIPQAVMIKGIESKKEAQTTCLEQLIISPKEALIKLAHTNHVLIGHKLAEQLMIEPTNTLQLLIPHEHQTKQNAIQLQSIPIIVGGIFKTGIEEFDANLIICSFDFLQSILPDSGVSFINIKVKEQVNQQQLIEQLQQRTGLDVYSWQGLYPALVSALKLEKYAAFLVLSLISLVASMSILALLFMFIIFKRTDIAILQAMGTPKKTIGMIFIIIGMIISIVASLAGLICAWLVGLLLKNYLFIELPDAYYSTTLPVALEFKLFGVIFITVLLLTLLATIVPVYNLKSNSISVDLKM